MCFCSPFLLTLTWQYSSWIASYCVLFTFILISNAIISVNRNSVCSNFVSVFFLPAVCGIHWNCCNPKMMKWNSIGPHDAQFCRSPEKEKRIIATNGNLYMRSTIETESLCTFWKVYVSLWLPMNGNSNLFIRMQWVFFFKSAIKTSWRPGLEYESFYWKQKKRF